MTQIVGLLPKAGICNLKTHARLHDCTRLPTSDRGDSTGGDERMLLRPGHIPVTSPASSSPPLLFTRKHVCTHPPPSPPGQRASVAESHSPAERLQPELLASAKDFSLFPPLFLWNVAANPLILRRGAQTCSRKLALCLSFVMPPCYPLSSTPTNPPPFLTR